MARRTVLTASPVSPVSWVIDGSVISGSWSDPWWNGQARRRVGGVPAVEVGGAHWLRVDGRAGRQRVRGPIPAMDERLLTPWTGATEAQARARETGAAA